MQTPSGFYMDCLTEYTCTAIRHATHSQTASNIPFFAWWPAIRMSQWAPGHSKVSYTENPRAEQPRIDRHDLGPAAAMKQIVVRFEDHRVPLRPP